MMNLKTTAAALALGFAACGASASTILFDADGSGAGNNYNAATGTFVGADSNPVLVEKFNLTSVPGTYSINQSLGADGVLGNGDLFQETFTLNLTSTQDFFGNPTGTYVTGLSTRVWMEVNLAGFITGYSDGGTPTTALSPLSFFDDTLSIVVDPTNLFNSATMYFDDDGDRVGSTVIATWKILGGGGDKPASNNSTATFDFGVDMQFTSMPVAGVWKTTSGEELSTVLPLVFAVADGSVNLPQGVPTGEIGGCFDGNDCLYLPVSDNQITARVNLVPEPASMALLGIGLLGLGVSRRRASKA